MLVSAVGSYAMTYYSLDISTFWIVWPVLLQGLGLGLIFVPLSTIAYATLERSRMAEAAGLYSLVRTVGAAAGISIVTTVLTRQAQVLWNELGANVNRFNPALQAYLAQLHLAPTDPHALAVIAQDILRQAQIGAMLDVFKLTTWSFLLMLPLILLIRRSRAAAAPPAAALE
jgi:DHA2 family multidrug resistance protein